MPVNEKFLELTGFSPTKANAMCTVAYTGAEISTLSSTAVDGQVVYCYSTGSGYTRGHWYGWDSQLAGGTWIDLVKLPATYDITSVDDYIFNNVVIDRRSGTREMYNYNFSGTGANVTNILSDNSYQMIYLQTGTTSTGWAAIYAGGPLIDWGKPAVLAVKFRTSSGAVTGQINKLGVNTDLAGTGPSTRRNFGVEWCDGDSSFQIHSGNGTNQSNFDTGITVPTDTNCNVTMYFDPGNEVRVWFDDGTTEQEQVKTTYIPSSGSGTEDGLMKFSIANNVGNTTNRELKIRAAYLTYSPADSLWWT